MLRNDFVFIWQVLENVDCISTGYPWVRGFYCLQSIYPAEHPVCSIARLYFSHTELIYIFSLISWLAMEHLNENISFWFKKKCKKLVRLKAIYQIRLAHLIVLMGRSHTLIIYNLQSIIHTKYLVFPRKFPIYMYHYSHSESPLRDWFQAFQCSVKFIHDISKFIISDYSNPLRRS